jgi:hypothetical protein
MTTEVTVSCDGLHCHNQLDSNGASDDVQQLLTFHHWHNDPTTDEFHYCNTCWPAVRSEYEDMKDKGELSSNG